MENKDILELVFIRHAETQYDLIEDRDNCDGNLTPRGEEQCRELGQKLKDVEIDAYLTSSLIRAFKTAAGVANAKPEKPLLEICPELIECGCTEGYYGCSEEYLRRIYPNAKMCDTNFYGLAQYDFDCSTKEANDIRAQKVMEYIKSRFTFGQRVAIFAHHGMLEHLIATALGVTPHVFRFSLANISQTTVLYTRDGHCILRDVNQ